MIKRGVPCFFKGEEYYAYYLSLEYFQEVENFLLNSLKTVTLWVVIFWQKLCASLFKGLSINGRLSLMLKCFKYIALLEIHVLRP